MMERRIWLSGNRATVKFRVAQRLARSDLARLQFAYLARVEPPYLMRCRLTATALLVSD